MDNAVHSLWKLAPKYCEPSVFKAVRASELRCMARHFGC